MLIFFNKISYVRISFNPHTYYIFSRITAKLRSPITTMYIKHGTLQRNLNIMYTKSSTLYLQSNRFEKIHIPIKFKWFIQSHDAMHFSKLYYMHADAFLRSRISLWNIPLLGIQRISLSRRKRRADVENMSRVCCLLPPACPRVACGKSPSRVFVLPFVP